MTSQLFQEHATVCEGTTRHRLPLPALMPFAVLVAMLMTPPPAAAQVYGTFPWQMQPYCNVVTLTLASTAAGWTLDGMDDQCGAANRASAVGVASFNSAGLVTLNFTVVAAPSARAVHVSAMVSPETGNGTWTDSAGNGGAMTFFGRAVGLPALPLPLSGLPAATVTSAELAPNAVTGSKVADASLSMADLANGPRLANSDPWGTITLGTFETTVQTLTIAAPAAGRVLVQGSGNISFTSTAAVTEEVRCSLSRTTADDSVNWIFVSDGRSTAGTVNVGFSTTRVFDVAAGAINVYLVCLQSAGSSPLPQAFGVRLSALYVAQ